MAVKFGAKIVDGFDVDTIRQEGDIVRVKSKTGVTHSAPSLGMDRDTSRDKYCKLIKLKPFQCSAPGPGLLRCWPRSG